MNDNERILDIEKDVNEIKNDIEFLKEVFENTRIANKNYRDKIQLIKELCNNKMKEYNSLIQCFKPEDEIVKLSKIERDLAQQIYTMLF